MSTEQTSAALPADVREVMEKALDFTGDETSAAYSDAVAGRFQDGPFRSREEAFAYGAAWMRRKGLDALRALLASFPQPTGASDAMEPPVGYVDQGCLRALKAGRQDAISLVSKPNAVDDDVPLYTRPLPVQASAPMQSLSLRQLCNALMEFCIVDEGAVIDSEGYDEGVTLGRIEKLHKKLASTVEATSAPVQATSGITDGGRGQ